MHSYISIRSGTLRHLSLRVRVALRSSWVPAIHSTVSHRPRSRRRRWFLSRGSRTAETGPVTEVDVRRPTEHGRERQQQQRAAMHGAMRLQQICRVRQRSLPRAARDVPETGRDVPTWYRTPSFAVAVRIL